MDWFCYTEINGDREGVLNLAVEGQRGRREKNIEDVNVILKGL